MPRLYLSLSAYHDRYSDARADAGYSTAHCCHRDYPTDRCCRHDYPSDRCSGGVYSNDAASDGDCSVGEVPDAVRSRR